MLLHTTAALPAAQCGWKQLLHLPFWNAFCLKSVQPHLAHGGMAGSSSAEGAADDGTTGFSAMGDVLAEVRVVTGVERTDEWSLAVEEDVVVVVLVVTVAASGAVVAASAASRFLASLLIRSELSAPPAPGSLNPPMPPILLPTVGAAAGAVVSAGVPSALGGALASGVAEAR